MTIFEEIAKMIGKLIYNYKILLKTPDFKAETVNFVYKISTSSNHIIRKYACYNFPAILLSLGPQHYADKIKEIFEKFVRDSQVEIRRTCAAQFHEIAMIALPKISLLVPLFHQLIRDTKVQ